MTKPYSTTVLLLYPPVIIILTGKIYTTFCSGAVPVRAGGKPCVQQQRRVPAGLVPGAPRELRPRAPRPLRPPCRAPPPAATGDRPLSGPRGRRL
jgi:hypothetical protein